MAVSGLATPELASIQSALAVPTIDADRPVGSIVDDVLAAVFDAPEPGPSAAN